MSKVCLRTTMACPRARRCQLGIHESQSRLWENHVGRSCAFWEKWLPRAKEIFPALHVSVNEMVRSGEPR